ncbi:hypothetical protein DIPPA_08856 [Diplonema papillatum]|nr:hypothetical protein DIPPA_08856 [Diplonema papillatum]
MALPPQGKEPPTTVLCLLCGLPGAGKTTVAGLLAKREDVCVRVLEFDALLNARLAAAESCAFTPELWHFARRSFLIACELLMRSTRHGLPNLDGNTDCPTESLEADPTANVLPNLDGNTARPAESLEADATVNVLPNLDGNTTCPAESLEADAALSFVRGSLRKCAESGTSSAERRTHVVLVEDNFCYKSERRPFLRLARRLQRSGLHVGFASVLLACPAEQCLDRNAGRADAKRVPEDLLRGMAERQLGPRDTDRWLSVFDNTVDHTAAQAAEFVVATCFDARVDKLHAGPDEGDTNLQLAEARTLTGKSVSHQLDLALRKATASLVGSLPPGLRRSFAPRFADLRKEALRHASVCDEDEVSRVVDLYHASALALVSRSVS